MNIQIEIISNLQKLIYYFMNKFLIKQYKMKILINQYKMKK